MDPETLVEGYLRVIGTIYDSTLENYFDRCLTLLENLNPVPHLHKPVSQHALYAGIMGIRQCLTPHQLPAFSRYIGKVTKNHRRLLPLAIRLAATGHHCEKFTRQQTMIREFKEYVTSELNRINEAGTQPISTSEAVDKLRQQALYRINARKKAIPEEFRYTGDGITESVSDFQLALDTIFDRAPVNGNLPVLN